MRTVKEIEQQAERAWARGELAERERGRMAELMRPPSPDDQRLHKPILVRCLRAFCVQGKPVTVGSTITLAKHDALSLEALGKVELL